MSLALRSLTKHKAILNHDQITSCNSIHLYVIKMAAFSRGVKSFSPRSELICSRCLPFSTIAAAQSGHSRWSKIKHDKGAVDAKKNVQRSVYAREIALCSKRTKYVLRKNCNC